MDFLSRLDEILLLSILRLKDNAYAVPVIQEIKNRTGRTISPGALWISMDNLYKRGYIKKKLADSTNEIGGRGKLYYYLTPSGIKALKRISELHETLWDDIGDMVSEIS
jgi:DNA-binding PadR family transcriptional regulator